MLTVHDDEQQPRYLYYVFHGLKTRKIQKEGKKETGNAGQFSTVRHHEVHKFPHNPHRGRYPRFGQPISRPGEVCQSTWRHRISWRWHRLGAEVSTLRGVHEKALVLPSREGLHEHFG